MKIFLKMKAWQLFALLFGTHFLTMAIGIVGGNPMAMLITMPIGMLVFMAVFMGWFWALGTNINRWVPEEIRPSPSRFCFGLIYASVYIIFFLAAFMFISADKASGVLFAIIFPLHIFAMVCMFYALYFVAKNLVMAEHRKKVGFYEFAGPFFLIWFYPIGIWFIQPKVNRLFNEQENMAHNQSTHSIAGSARSE